MFLEGRRERLSTGGADGKGWLLMVQVREEQWLLLVWTREEREVSSGRASNGRAVASNAPNEGKGRLSMLQTKREYILMLQTRRKGWLLKVRWEGVMVFAVVTGEGEEYRMCSCQGGNLVLLLLVPL